MTSLPQGWTLLPVADLVLLNPKTTAADDTVAGFSPMSCLGARYRDEVSYEPRLWGEIRKTYVHFQDGDVLLAKITPCFENGKAGLVRAMPNGIGAGSSEYFVCRSDARLLDPRYLLALFKSEKFLKEGETRMTGSVGHKRLPKDYLLATEVPLPPRAEQQRIADKLDVLLAQVDACHARLDNVPSILKRFRRSVLSAAASGQLTADWRTAQGRHGVPPLSIDSESGNSPHYEFKHNLPSGWQVVRAQFVVEPEADIVYGIVQPGPKLTSGVPYVQITDIVDGCIQVQNLSHTNEDIAKSYRRSTIRGGDVLLGIIRATKVAVVPDELEGANISRSVARLRPRPGILPNYLAIALEAPVVQDWLRSQHRGMDMPVLNLSEVRLAPLPIAPIAEQAEIVLRVKNLFALADSIASSHAAARAQVERLTPALLAKALRGELVPQAFEGSDTDPIARPRTDSNPLVPRRSESRRHEAKTKAAGSNV